MRENYQSETFKYEANTRISPCKVAREIIRPKDWKFKSNLAIDFQGLNNLMYSFTISIRSKHIST